MKTPLKTITLRLDEKEINRLKRNAYMIDSNYNQEVRRAIEDRNKKLERKINK
jgi:hypothetical protein